MTPKITMPDAPDGAAIQLLVKNLIAFNEAQGGPRNAQPVLLLVRHPETDEVLGGLYGATVYDALKIELLYLDPLLRGQGYGRLLMEQAETEALKRGCTGAWLETFSFQARDFYERLGYEVFATLPEFPRGHSLHFMRKTLEHPPAVS